MDASNRDKITIYEDSPESRAANGIGYPGVWKKSHVSVEIICGTSQALAEAVKSEALRIIETYAASPGGTFQFINPSEIEVQPLSTLSRRTWRWIISIQLENTNVSKGG
jgi:hypothetical protein